MFAGWHAASTVAAIFVELLPVERDQRLGRRWECRPGRRSPRPRPGTPPRSSSGSAGWRRSETGHGDVAAAQLGGQVGEHAHFQVPTGQHPGMALVPQGLAPRVRLRTSWMSMGDLNSVLAGGPRTTDSSIQSPAPGADRPHELQRVPDRPVLAGRLKRDGVDQGKQRLRGGTCSIAPAAAGSCCRGRAATAWCAAARCSRPRADSRALSTSRPVRAASPSASAPSTDPSSLSSSTAGSPSTAVSAAPSARPSACPSSASGSVNT